MSQEELELDLISCQRPVVEDTEGAGLRTGSVAAAAATCELSDLPLLFSVRRPNTRPWYYLPTGLSAILVYSVQSIPVCFIMITQAVGLILLRVSVE